VRTPPLQNRQMAAKTAVRTPPLLSLYLQEFGQWIPAFAGMTEFRVQRKPHPLSHLSGNKVPSGLPSGIYLIARFSRVAQTGAYAFQITEKQ